MSSVKLRRARRGREGPFGEGERGSKLLKCIIFYFWKKDPGSLLVKKFFLKGLPRRGEQGEEGGIDKLWKRGRRGKNKDN
jgi:hypothetical protein